MADVHCDAYRKLVELLPDLPRLPPGSRAVFRSELGGQDLELRVLDAHDHHSEIHMASLDGTDPTPPPCREIRIELDSETREARVSDYRTGGEPSSMILKRDGTYPALLMAWLRSIRRRTFRPLSVEEALGRARRMIPADSPNVCLVCQALELLAVPVDIAHELAQPDTNGSDQLQVTRLAYEKWQRPMGQEPRAQAP